MAAHRSDEKAALDVLASLTHADARNNSPIRERKITKPGPCSRKNKPQRCSTCGLVGHKARTCRKAAPEGDGIGPPPTKKRIDQAAASAADGLLKMFGAAPPRSPIDLSKVPGGPKRPLPAVVIARAAPVVDAAGPVLGPEVAGSRVLFAYPAVMAQAVPGEPKRKHAIVQAIPALQQLDSGASCEM